MDLRGRKVLFIINKYAGTGYLSELEGCIIDICATHDVTCSIEFTRSRGHATELAKEANEKGFELVVAVGGDGTINEVAQGVIHTTMPMGILPKGSGNGLSRHLEIPLTLRYAVESLFTSELINMDILLVNGKLSLNVSGIGFDGHIANLFDQTKQRGLIGYASLSIKEFFRYNEFAATLQVNELQLPRKAFIIAFANSSQYGNNARIAPNASVCDGLMHINIIQKIPAYRADFMVRLFAATVHQSTFCELITSNKVSVTTPYPVALHIDGEPSGMHQSFTAEVIPGALQLLAPCRKIGSII